MVSFYRNAPGQQKPSPFFKEWRTDTRTDNDVWLTQAINITPMKGLKIRGDFSYRYYWSDGEEVQSEVDVLRGFHGFEMDDVNDFVYTGRSATDWIESNFTKNTYYVFNTFAEYVREDLGDHYLKALVGFNQEYGMNHAVSTRAYDLVSPNIHSLTSTTGTKNKFRHKE